MYKWIFKRFTDFTLSLIGLVCVMPVFLLVGFLLFFVNKGQPFFIQDRPGKGGKIFKVIKFKTMNDCKDKQGRFLPDEKRLTKVGRFVRSASIDELPQLLNVLKGDMSLVGPRPLLVKYLPLYNTQQAKRHIVRPGITGWAQVNGRNALSWEEKFDLDVFYVENITFTLDMKIILMTIYRILKREGIGSATSSTMEAFLGNSEQK